MFLKLWRQESWPFGPGWAVHITGIRSWTFRLPRVHHKWLICNWASLIFFWPFLANFCRNFWIWICPWKVISYLKNQTDVLSPSHVTWCTTQDFLWCLHFVGDFIQLFHFPEDFQKHDIIKSNYHEAPFMFLAESKTFRPLYGLLRYTRAVSVT